MVHMWFILLIFMLLLSTALDLGRCEIYVHFNNWNSSDCFSIKRLLSITTFFYNLFPRSASFRIPCCRLSEGTMFPLKHFPWAQSFELSWWKRKPLRLVRLARFSSIAALNECSDWKYFTFIPWITCVFTSNDRDDCHHSNDEINSNAMFCIC